jgi:hypothetical protein
MSGDKRSVTTDALETLGKIISVNEKRDAIHLAVEPVRAASVLFPGQDVGFIEPGVAGVTADPVGIVDPFLNAPVQKDQMFWLVVYPRQITSLRHVWEHPKFPESQDLNSGAKTVSPKEQHQQQHSWDYVHSLAGDLGVSAADLINHAKIYVQSLEDGEYGEYWVDGGMFEGKTIPDEFWPHFTLITGIEVPEEHQQTFLSCSC